MEAIPSIYKETYWYTGIMPRRAVGTIKAREAIIEPTIIANRQELYRIMCELGKPKWFNRGSAPRHVTEHIDNDSCALDHSRAFDHVEVYKIKPRNPDYDWIWITITSPYGSKEASWKELEPLGYLMTEPIYGVANTFMRVIVTKKIPSIGKGGRVNLKPATSVRVLTEEKLTAVRAGAVEWYSQL